MFKIRPFYIAVKMPGLQPRLFFIYCRFMTKLIVSIVKEYPWIYPSDNALNQQHRIKHCKDIHSKSVLKHTKSFFPSTSPAVLSSLMKAIKAEISVLQISRSCFFLVAFQMSFSQINFMSQANRSNANHVLHMLARADLNQVRFPPSNRD